MSADLPALLPCPHCGAEAVLHENVIGGYFVDCSRAGCGEDGAEAEAIAAWNTRAPDPAMGSLIDATASLNAEKDREIARLWGLLAQAEAALRTAFAFIDHATYDEAPGVRQNSWNDYINLHDGPVSADALAKARTARDTLAAIRETTP